MKRPRVDGGASAPQNLDLLTLSNVTTYSMEQLQNMDADVVIAVASGILSGTSQGDQMLADAKWGLCRVLLKNIFDIGYAPLLLNLPADVLRSIIMMCCPQTTYQLSRTGASNTGKAAPTPFRFRALGRLALTCKSMSMFMKVAIQPCFLAWALDMDSVEFPVSFDIASYRGQWRLLFSTVYSLRNNFNCVRVFFKSRIPHGQRVIGNLRPVTATPHCPACRMYCSNWSFIRSGSYKLSCSCGFSVQAMPSALPVMLRHWTCKSGLATCPNPARSPLYCVCSECVDKLDPKCAFCSVCFDRVMKESKSKLKAGPRRCYVY